MKKIYLVLFTFLSVGTLVACGTSDNGVMENGTKKVGESIKKNKENSLDLLNRLVSQGEETDELYVTGDITVGENGDVKPGVYDLEVTGGSGNIFGERAHVSQLFINWTAGAPGSDSMYASKIRMLLFDGDTLKMSDISKVKFTPVPEEVEPTNELGIGEFIVGRDINAGDYKLNTNMKMNPEFDNLGWSIGIYNDETGDLKNQSFNPGNDDVAVSLKDGEVISLSFDNVEYGTSADTAKLIFEELK